MLLVLGLLGGGMVSLLVVNTTLAANSFQISGLQQQNAAMAAHVQELQQQVAAERSASVIEQKALQLGMRPASVLTFVDLRTKSVWVRSGLGVAAMGRPSPIRRSSTIRKANAMRRSKR